LDGQIFDTRADIKIGGKEGRIVYQYKQKRAELDLRNIDKQIRKAQWHIDNGLQQKKPKFMKLRAE
jgi:P pilus assembly chaperone PapD